MNGSRVALCLALGGLLLVAGPSTASSPAVSVMSHGPRSAGTVALTFDDGVNPANCRRILAILVSRGVPATFFPIADAMRADPAFWRLVVAAADPIGDHTLTHPQMVTLTEAQQFRQIDGARRLAESLSGAPLLRVFRPPYGTYDAATLSAAARAGFGTVLLWDTSGRDTSQHGTVAEMIAAAEEAREGSVILMHCGPNATPFILGPLLDHLEAAGLRPVTVPALLGLRWTPSPAASPPTPAEILDGLAPLPSAASGGVLVGPSGIGTMTFPPAPPPTSTPQPTASPMPAADTPSPTAGSPAPAASPSPSESLSPTAIQDGDVPSQETPAAIPDAALLVGLAAALLGAAIVALGLARAHRR